MRLVSLAPSNTEIVWALGLADALVGVDDHSDFPPGLRAARVGPDLKIRLDDVERLRPDLVLASLSVPGMERNVAGLQARGLPHLVLNPQSLEDVFADIATVAARLGVPARGRALVADLRGRVERARAATARRGRLRVLWEWWHKPLISPGRPSWMTDVLAAAGAENVFADLDAPSRAVDPEEAARRDPDAVCVCWCGVMQERMRPELLAARPGWAGLRALVTGRVYPLPEALFGRPGPRLVEGIELLAGLLWTEPAGALERFGLSWSSPPDGPPGPPSP